MYGKSNMETYIAATAKSLQSCPTLCDPIDGSPPGSPVPGILQASTLEWVETYITICKIVLFFFFLMLQEMSCIHMASKYANTKHVMKIL